ncbi:MAG: hypothetical protein ABJA71_11510 [Ginsengibacter sp.]
MESDETNQPLSDDPHENMQIENEILKLKLKAQFGEALQMETGTDLLPEIENKFLKNVQAFEEAHQNIKYTKVDELLGKPDYKKANELSDKEITEELSRIEEIMEKNKMVLDVLAEYDDRTIYTFITEELFEHKTATGEGLIPGMITHFTYEEFRPNHKYDINNRAKEFLSGWFEQKFNEYSWELGNEFVIPDGRMLGKQEVLNKFKAVFDAYTKFVNCQHVIAEINFQLNEEIETGMGHAEGGVKYDAILENGEQVHIEGPFKLYMSMEYDWWKIFYFVFPGFEW